VCNRCSAASVRLPVSATARKYRRCRSSISLPVLGIPDRHAHRLTKSLSARSRIGRLSHVDSHWRVILRRSVGYRRPTEPYADRHTFRGGK
jgi:hypothetical protein